MSFSFTAENFGELRFRFEEAVIKCSERCLFQSAKWSAEMLDSLTELDGFGPSDTVPSSPVPDEDTMNDQKGPNPFLPTRDATEASLEAAESRKYLLAKCFFETREFDRCAAVFLPQSVNPVPLGPRPPQSAQHKTSQSSPQNVKGKKPMGAPNTEDALLKPFNPPPMSRSPLPRLSQKSLFLALYAKYLAGEKRRDEETEMILGPADGGMTVNRELPWLARSLEGYFAHIKAIGLENRGHGWLEYLYGVVLLKGKNQEGAREWLIKAVHMNPFHWGAWQELNGLVDNADDLKHVMELLPQNIMTLIFHLYCSQELGQPTDDLHLLLTELENIFPNSAFLKTQRALLYSHSKDYEEASQVFGELVVTNPYRLDGLDHYSNVLFVLNARPQLAFIAQLATATDKFRPETCIVVANYYGLKSEHEKAVMYFRRALTLDRNNLTAWTLMGHEYLEMKNTHAAIESYRRAIDVNRKDHRAWYGLGQLYEILDMSLYALYYYHRAAALCPYEAKTWLAVGTCYSRMGRIEQAIRALKRALVAGSYYETATGMSFSNGGAKPSQNVPLAKRILDPDTLVQIAHLYERLGDEEEVASYMELTLQQETGQPVDGADDNDDDDEDNSNTNNNNNNNNNNAGDVAAKKTPKRAAAGNADEDDQDMQPFGTGVTASTSRARLWLARYALKLGNLERADTLANELCHDGIEVEEAKALVRDVRARRESGYGQSGNRRGRNH